ncbi:MAG: hypothetical protein IKE22_01485 [Atopobiaceae bacterium]|nr:hypothetical protein [Atopobiaceae bacterium]
MAEVLLSDGSSWSGLFGGGESDLAVWIWRAGGAITWPVFMWMLLNPHVRTAEGNSKVIVPTCIAAAIYGGFGLWLVNTVLELCINAVEAGASFMAPLVALVGIVLPFMYVWGFVALYATARSRLLDRPQDFAWVGQSAWATIVGVYGIGILIYLAMSAVAIPIALIISPIAAMGAEEVAWHIAVDMLAIAISTGNFASQWWAFKRVDDYFAQIENPYAATYTPPVPQVPVGQAPVYQQAPMYQAPVAQAPVPQAVPQQPAQAASQPAALPRLFCTCGQELTLDEARLPNVVAKEAFCPSCGARIAHN